MVQPIQYQIPGALNPFENLVSGLKLGATMADMDTARAQQQAATQLAQQKALAEQAKIAQQQQYQAGLNAFFAKPPAERSIEELQPLLVGGNKEQFEALKSIGDRMSADQLASSKKFTGQVLVALESNPESAKQILRQRAEVEKDPMQKKAWEDTLKLAETSPEQAAHSVELLGAGVFGKDWYDSISNVRKARREALNAPFAQRTAEAAARTGEAAANVAEGTKQAKIDEAIAVAKKAQIELETLPQIKAAELSKAKSASDKAAVEAKFAERIANADLKLKEAQRIASGAATQSSLAAAKLTEQQTLKLKDEIARGPMPTYNAEIGGWIAPPTKENPNGSVIPLNAAADLKQQKAAVNALKSAGYNPETGEDNITRLIKKSTGSTLGALTDTALRTVGLSMAGADAINALASTANAIATDLLGGKLGAGISNADRDFIVGTLGDVSNPYKTADERLAGWNAAKNRMMLSGMIPPPQKVKPEGSFGTPATTPNPAKAAAVRSQADAILRGEK